MVGGTMSNFRVEEVFNRCHRSAHSYNDVQNLCEAILKSDREFNEFDDNAATLNGSLSQAEPIVLLDFDEVDFLVQENKEMKALISDYHRGIEILMQVFRKLVLDNMEAEQAEHSDQKSDSTFLRDIIIQQSYQIYEMHEIMKKAAAIDDDEESVILEQISFLRKQNVALRELCNISKNIGSSDLLLLKEHKKDQSCQTDDQPFEILVFESKAIDTEVSKNEGAESEVVESEVTVTESGEGEAAESEVSGSKVAESEAAESEAAESEAAESEAVESEAAMNEVGGREAAADEVGDHEAAENEVGDREAAADEASRREAAKSEAAESEIYETETVESDSESDNDDAITVIGMKMNENDNDENDEREKTFRHSIAQEEKI